MTIFKLYSQRQKEEKGGLPDVFVYDNIPDPLRIQINYILKDIVGDDCDNNGNYGFCFNYIKDILWKEHGLTGFPYVREVSSHEKVFKYFLNLDSIDKTLDVIELSFRIILHVREQNLLPKHCNHFRTNPKEAVDELNERFKQHGIGYRFESGKIIRIDSDLVHQEIVKPALGFLRAENLQGANEEFLRAHEHYRHGRYKEALADALKAFESTLKSICTDKKWDYKATDGTKKLLDLVFEKGLLPKFMESEFTALRNLLTDGVPTVRNKLGGHGQGVEAVSVPDYWARYAIHSTAANILLLVEAAQENN